MTALGIQALLAVLLGAAAFAYVASRAEQHRDQGLDCERSHASSVSV